ncbi:polyprenyl synthetase family protein [Paenibacillus psychroresistens]|uniref:polyprenyl synthetase family protein n=1 Tax=Paenibacillus psychroresistens TaxID=1778678 RepID=UPI001390EC21|nr:class 1 isoprenoid biosynthesis enzyme [Paenibacillus psychroresistens]
MELTVQQELNRIVNQYFPDTVLNGLIKLFIADKAEEGSRWFEITRYSHLMLGGNSLQIDRLACLTEWVMLWFDITDDLQDRDNFSKPWMTCPPEHTLNAMLAFPIAFIGEIGELEVDNSRIRSAFISKVSYLLASAIIGQQVDLNHSVHTEQDYMQMIEKRAGVPLQFACYLGYAWLELSEEIREQMNDLALCIGVIAQIGNDMRDILSFDLKNDLLQKKRTLPIIYLLEDSREEFPALAQYYAGEITDEVFLESKLACIQYVQDSGCLEYSRIIQSLYRQRAEEIFTELPLISPWKEKFREITFA